MGQGFLIDVLPLLPDLFHNVIYLDRVPVQNGVGHKTETTGLVHDFFIVTGGKFTLVGEEDPAWQLVPLFALIQLPLNSTSQFLICQVAQNVFSLDDPTQVGEGLSETIRR
jgi:hypothetical protein